MSVLVWKERRDMDLYWWRNRRSGKGWNGVLGVLMDLCSEMMRMACGNDDCNWGLQLREKWR